MGKRKDKDRIACECCGWDGEVRIWGGRFPPYQRITSADDLTDPMKRPRPLAPAWRDGMCGLCAWQTARAA